MSTYIGDGLSEREALENKHEATVREEIEIFRTKSQSFLAGEISENDFRPFRLTSTEFTDSDSRASR